MESPQVLHAAARQLDSARRHATSNDLAEQNGKAWGKTCEAEWHAALVEKFMIMSDAARNHAARLESYGRMAAAGLQYELAQRHYDTAMRHQKASEECQAAGDKMSGEMRAKTQPQRNRRPPPAAATPSPEAPPSQTGARI